MIRFARRRVFAARTTRLRIVAVASAFTAVVFIVPVIDAWTFGLGSCVSQAAEPCAVKLPARVQELIRKMPAWKIVQLADLTEDHRRMWITNRPTECPGIAIGQFVDSGEETYAILFHSRGKNNPRQKLLVLRLGKDGVESHTVGEWPASRSEPLAVIWKVGPGKYTGFDRLREIQTTRDAIALEVMEAGADLYYWSGGRFQKLTISD